ncbi:MAG: FAD:protein FMN transferase [Dehalococcoidia bacterium]
MTPAPSIAPGAIPSTTPAGTARVVVDDVAEFRAMNTDWWIGAPGADRSLLRRAEAIVHRSEARLSRFLGDSLVSRLNAERRVEDRELAALVRRALEIGPATGGAFDIRVGAAVAAAGYDRSFELLPSVVDDDRLAPPVQMLRVEVDGDAVSLEGIGAVDLGGIAKGWTIDRVAEAFEAAGVASYLVDGGGDIRARGCGPGGEPWLVGVGDGLAVRLASGAVCTSSTLRRRWTTVGGTAHHIIDPVRALPAVELITNAVVVAPDAATADALATAVIASPSIVSVAPSLGAETFVEREGTWEMTPGMGGWLA